jgi:hypothetical protein
MVGDYHIICTFAKTGILILRYLTSALPPEHNYTEQFFWKIHVTGDHDKFSKGCNEFINLKHVLGTYSCSPEMWFDLVVVSLKAKGISNYKKS